MSFRERLSSFRKAQQVSLQEEKERIETEAKQRVLIEAAHKQERLARVLELKDKARETIVPILEIVNSEFLEGEGELNLSVRSGNFNEDGDGQEDVWHEDNTRVFCNLGWNRKRAGGGDEEYEIIILRLNYNNEIGLSAGFNRERQWRLENKEWKGNVENAIIDALESGNTFFRKDINLELGKIGSST